MTEAVKKRPYPKLMAVAAALPMYLAAAILLFFVTSSAWLTFLLWLPCWHFIDKGVSRMLVWQVNSLRRTAKNSLLAIAGIGIAIDIIIAVVLYALS